MDLKNQKEQKSSFKYFVLLKDWIRKEKNKLVETRSGLKTFLTKIKFFDKFHQNPIIEPNNNEWESWQTFNPGVVKIKDKIHIIYRAVGSDGVSRLGYAVSTDGFTIKHRLSYPVFEHREFLTNDKYLGFSFSSGNSLGGAEDPRPVYIKEDKRIYMTYTALYNGLRVGFSSISVSDFLNKRWLWTKPIYLSPPNQVHKNWILFPEKINGYYVFLTSITPNIVLHRRKTLVFKKNEYISSYYDTTLGKSWLSPKGWEKRVRAVGPVPIKTKYGWLVFYHAMDDKDPDKYKVGAMLLDLNDPKKIIVRSPVPVLEPDTLYELNGNKPGIVYASAAVVFEGNLIIYYGAADNYIAIAFANLESFLQDLLKYKKPDIKSNKLLQKSKYAGNTMSTQPDFIT
ncbi:MAG: glycosidase [Patescibacteria group bacterium]|nr:MAG: glycosidase [Patescibacteria group bacterium]